MLATPAVSALIPSYEAFGGIILTASQNPVGAEADRGNKYNIASGAPAQDEDDLTSKSMRLSRFLNIGRETAAETWTFRHW